MSTDDLKVVDIMIRNAWYKAGFSEEFETEVLRREVICEKVLVFWRTAEGEVVAFDDRCCHKRMPISAGRFLEGGIVECPYHGLAFNSEGQCVKIPSAPDAPIPKRARLLPYKVIEQDGVVWVWPGDAEKIGNIRPPATPEIVSPDWEHITGELYIKGNSILMIENALDITHFYPLHGNTIGQSADSDIKFDMTTGETCGCDSVTVTRQVDNYPQSDDFADLLTHKMADSHSIQTMVGPGIIIAGRTLWPAGGRTENKDPKTLKNYHFLTPIDRRSHKYTYVVNMPKGQMSGRDPKVRAVDRAKELLRVVFEEDIWAIEKQQEMCELPDGDYREVLLKSDLPLAAGRKILDAMYRREMHEHAV